ncbi:hypothetical protein [Actinomadura sp. 9N215]
MAFDRRRGRLRELWVEFRKAEEDDELRCQVRSVARSARYDPALL